MKLYKMSMSNNKAHQDDRDLTFWAKSSEGLLWQKKVSNQQKNIRKIFLFVISNANPGTQLQLSTMFFFTLPVYFFLTPLSLSILLWDSKGAKKGSRISNFTVANYGEKIVVLWMFPITLSAHGGVQYSGWRS